MKIKTKKNILIIISIIGTILSVLIIGLRVFFPYHVIIGIILYIITWIPFVIMFKEWKEKNKKYQHKTKLFIKSNYKPISISLLIIITSYLLWIIFPFNNFQLLEANEENFSNQIQQDLFLSEKYIENSNKIINKITENAKIYNSDYDKLSSNQKENLINLWSEYLEYTKELEKLKQYYRNFYQINYIKYPELNFKAFLIAYSSFLTNYQNTLQLYSIIQNNNTTTTLLNEANDKLEIGSNSYYQLTQQLNNPNNLVRLNAGESNIKLIQKINPAISLQYKDKITSLEKQYKDIYNLMGKTPEIFIENPLSFFEKNTFESWFPFQKTIALGMGTFRTKSRDYFISQDLIKEIKPELEPGDILLQRRNWHLSNIGIPGFWPHAAIYTGTLDEMKIYFKDTKVNNIGIEEALLTLYPETYKKYKTKDQNNYEFSIIEAIAEGVVLQSLEKSANADYLAVFRPNLSKEEKMKALIDAFSHEGKPYDYNFDFVTDNELVCSELVYKAYQPNQNKTGINFNIGFKGGRFVLAPNEILEKFINESNTQNPQLSFVLFIDGNEKTQSAKRKNIEALKETLHRPKWDILQQ